MSDAASVVRDIVTAVFVIAAVILAFITARYAREAARVTDGVVPRRPTEAQSPSRLEQLRSPFGRRLPWLNLAIAAVFLWLLLILLKPMSWLPVPTPSSHGSSVLGMTTLRIDLRGRRPENGDAFIAQLRIEGQKLSGAPCNLAHARLNAVIAAPASDVAQAQALNVSRLDCVASAEWIVVPKHGGRQIISVRVTQRGNSSFAPDLSMLEVEADVDRGIGGDALLSGVIAIAVSLIGLLTPGRKDKAAELR